MPETKNELEARSVRFILEAVLSKIGELSDFLPYDPKTLPFILKKIEQIANDLSEAEQRAMKDREKRMKDLASILGTDEDNDEEFVDGDEEVGEDERTEEDEDESVEEESTCEECTAEELNEAARSKDPGDYLVVEDKNKPSTWHLPVKKKANPALD